MSTRTLSQFLSDNGLAKTAAAPATADASKTAAAPAAAPAKTAAPAAPAKAAADQTASKGTESQPSTGEPTGGKKPRDKATDAETGKSAEKTAAQTYLEGKGVIVADPAVAEQMVEGMRKQAEINKAAALEKRAAEERARGAIFYQGMIGEQTAWKIASGEATVKEAAVVAAGLGVDVTGILKRAEQLQAAMSSPAFVDGHLGSAAKVDASAVQQVADKNDNTSTTRSIEAIEGTRQPTSGADEKVLKFIDAWTLPGNPGLNHGQAVDQGKR
jgi:hypothetical protein